MTKLLKDERCTVTVSISSGTAWWWLTAVPDIIFVVTWCYLSTARSDFDVPIWYYKRCTQYGVFCFFCEIINYMSTWTLNRVPTYSQSTCTALIRLSYCSCIFVFVTVSRQSHSIPFDKTKVKPVNSYSALSWVFSTSLSKMWHTFYKASETFYLPPKTSTAFPHFSYYLLCPAPINGKAELT